MGEGITPGGFSAGAKIGFNKPIIFTSQPLKGKDEAYLGPRKVDDPPQVTLHYGDGKYVMQFHFSRDAKSAERGGETSCKTKPDDKKDTVTEGTDSDEGYGGQYGI